MRSNICQTPVTLVCKDYQVSLCTYNASPTMEVYPNCTLLSELEEIPRFSFYRKKHSHRVENTQVEALYSKCYFSESTKVLASN